MCVFCLVFLLYQSNVDSHCFNRNLVQQALIHSVNILSSRAVIREFYNVKKSKSQGKEARAMKIYRSLMLIVQISATHCREKYIMLEHQ